MHQFNFMLNLLASCLLGVSGLFSVAFASEEKPASWSSFFPGQELDDILFGQIGDRSPLISMIGKGYEVGTQVEGKLETELPLNISKAAAKQMAERLGPKMNAKNLRKMVGVELMAEVVIKYRKTTEIMIRSTNPLLGPMSIEKK